jgi:hypothetical protein
VNYDRNTLYDGFVTLERGVDSGRTPASLQRNQCSFAINTTFRGGHPECRPGFIKRKLNFLDSSSDVDQTLLARFQDGLFQGAAFYDGGWGKSSLIASIGGRLFRIEPEKQYAVTDITPTDANSSKLPKAWFCQAEEFMVVQDGQSPPTVYDGSGVRRLQAGRELPVGTVMTYGQGRIWMASPDGYRFVAGDLAYGSSGSPKYGYRDSVIKFTENDFLNEGGYFAVPQNSGGITGMTFTSSLDTSLGQGPMLVFTRNQIASCQAPIDRTAWKDLEYPIQTIALRGYGATGDRSVAVVNGDVFYRADDGIRSFKLARRDFSTWGNTPVSAEMNRVLTKDSREYLDYCSAVVFDNRLLSTVSPYWVQGHGVPHRGLAVLDFDILSRMHGAQQPAWEGIWTGLNVLQLVVGSFNGVEKCFAFVLNGANQVELWEVSRDYPHDYGDAGDSRIEWSIEFKSLDFESLFELKSLEYGEVFIDRLQGDCNIKADYRPDEYPLWQSWHEGWSEGAEDKIILTANSMTPPALPRKQYRSKMGLPEPDYAADEIEDLGIKKFFVFQPRLEFRGHCRLRGLRIVARVEQEQARGESRT